MTRICAEGDHMQALRQAAATHGINVVMGFNERSRPTSATLYNSSATISAYGELLGAHRKMLPTHTERLVWTPGDAHGLRAYDTSAGRVGDLVCWEHWHPIARHAMHHSDEQIHVALWPDMPGAHQLASRSKERGIDISAETPKILTTEAVQASDVVITMGCGDTCPVFPGKRYLDWQLDDPAGQGVDAVRPIRNEIEQRVRDLLAELDIPATT